MKTLKTLLLSTLILLFVSCSTDSIDEECNCSKETYTWEQSTTIGANGLPVLVSRKVILSSEAVNCQDEQSQTNTGNNTYFDIICN